MMFYVGQTHRPSGQLRQAHVQNTIERFLNEEVLGKAGN
jgi:dipeptidyl-peptidase-4